MALPKNTRAILECYAMRYGPFIVQHTLDPPAKWRVYGTEEYYENYDYRLPKHRIIFRDEVIFEPDVEDKQLNDEISREIVRRLKQYGVNYRHWHGGNKSNHIHVTFPALAGISDIYRPSAKWEVIKFFAYGLITEGKMDKGMTLNKHLVRVEYAMREDKKGRKKLIEERDDGRENVLPLELENRIIAKLEKIRHSKFSKTLKYRNKELPPLEADECINFILSDDFSEVQDGRKKAAFILACFLVKKHGKTEAESILKSWNEKILYGYLPNNHLVSVIESVHKGGYTLSKRYKCDFLRSINREDVISLLMSNNKRYK